MPHSAKRAVMADGPNKGETYDVRPGQEELMLPTGGETFEEDQTEEAVRNTYNRYTFDEMTVNDDDLAVFRFQGSTLLAD